MNKHVWPVRLLLDMSDPIASRCLTAQTCALCPELPPATVSCWQLLRLCWEAPAAARARAKRRDWGIEKTLPQIAELLTFPERSQNMLMVISPMLLLPSVLIRSCLSAPGNPSTFKINCFPLLHCSSRWLISYVCYSSWNGYLFSFSPCFPFFRLTYEFVCQSFLK